MLVLLCPTKGRPEQFKRMVKSAVATSKLPLKIYVCISREDYDSYPQLDNVVYVIRHELLPTVHKWNLLADISIQDIDTKLFIVAGDDMVFTTPGWDEAIRDHYNQLTNKAHVYALQDSRDKDGTPHPIITREYIQYMGYLLPPLFLHWFADSWIVDIAKYNDCFTHFRDFELTHDKPSDQGEPDATHTGIRSYGWHDRDKWVDARCRNTLRVEEMQRLRSWMR